MSYMNTPMIDKNDAINRYVKTQFSTHDKVEEFMVAFLRKHEVINVSCNSPMI